MRLTIPLLLATFCPIAQAVTINWATSQTSSGFTTPGNALGAPDGAAAANLGGSLTVSGFTAPPVAYDNAALAVALNLGSLPVFNVILLEFNGTPGFGWETTDFSFSDGGAPVTMQFNSGASAGMPTNYIVAIGAMTRAAYFSFFGVAFPGSVGDIPYLLLNLNGVNVSSPAFQLTVNSFGGGTPDPDAIGIVSGVPEPSSAVLLLSAVGALAIRLRRQRAESR